MLIISNISSSAGNVASMATNLVIGDALKKTERYEYKNKKFEEVCYHCGKKGHLSKDCQVWKNSNHKIFEKAEKAVYGAEDDLMLCSLMSER